MWAYDSVDTKLLKLKKKIDELEKRVKELEQERDAAETHKMEQGNMTNDLD